MSLEEDLCICRQVRELRLIVGIKLEALKRLVKVLAVFGNWFPAVERQIPTSVPRRDKSSNGVTQGAIAVRRCVSCQRDRQTSCSRDLRSFGDFHRYVCLFLLCHRCISAADT